LPRSDRAMESDGIEVIKGLINPGYATLGEQARNSRTKLITSLLTHRKLPATGWDDASIELFLQEVGAFEQTTAGADRESRVFACDLVRRRHYGISSSACDADDKSAGKAAAKHKAEPRVAGSPLVAMLTRYLVLDAIHVCGIKAAKTCAVLPAATGLSIALVFLALRQQRPQAKYVVWSRIDQKSCFKAIGAAGLSQVVIELKRIEGTDALGTDVPAIRAAIERLGAENVLCVCSTTSTFAPRVPDSIDEIAVLCNEAGVPHVINNAYGLQCSKCSHLVETACRKGRVDAFVQSTDKNFLVPVGGAIIASPKTDLVDHVLAMYPDRVSMSPILDLFMTLLSLGESGWKDLLEKRKTTAAWFQERLTKVISAHGLQILRCPANKISIAVDLQPLVGDGDPARLTFLGSALFTRRVSGPRVVLGAAAKGHEREGEAMDAAVGHIEVSGKYQKKVDGIAFDNYGAHSSDYPCCYVTTACAVGATQEELDAFLVRFDQALHEFKGTGSAKPATKKSKERQNEIQVARARAMGELQAGAPQIPAEEGARQLQKFAGSAALFPDGCLHHLVERTAMRVPENPAVEFKDSPTLTYAELDRCCSKFSSELVSKGVSIDVIVALQLGRSQEMVVAILAVLKAGGGYLPLDPKWPVDRRQFILEDASCQRLIVQTLFVEEFAFFNGSTFLFDDCRKWLHDGTEMTTQHVCKPEALAYVIYTSGSTGNPKGVMMPHRGVVSNISLCAGICMAEGMRWCFSNNYTFDVHVADIFMPLAVGGVLVVTTDIFRIAPVDIVDTLPSKMVLAKVPKSLKFVRFIGEAITEGAVRCIPETTRTLNIFGASEFFDASLKEIDRSTFPDRLRSIGRPLPNVFMFVADPKSFTLQPMGVPGELVIGGIQVSRGYIKRPDLTSTKFVEAPWATKEAFPGLPSNRVYRTGDLVRWLPDGEMEYLGRAESQVEVRGHRFELGSIEHALRSLTGISEAVVMLRSDMQTVASQAPVAEVGQAMHLVAYVSPKEARDLVPELFSTLPDYMRPDITIGVDEWPRMSSGKIDKTRLPTHGGGESSVDQGRDGQKQKQRPARRRWLFRDAGDKEEDGADD